MGCGASYEEVGDDYVHDASKYRTYGIIKSYYGAPQFKLVQGTSKSRVYFRPVFAGESGSKESILLLTIKSDVDLESQGTSEGSTQGGSREHDSHTESEDGGRGRAERRGASGDSRAVHVRWGMFNDSSNTAVVSCTFNRARGIVVLADDAEVEELNNNKLFVKLSVPSGKTVLFVEGSISTYTWQCSLIDSKGTAEELTALAVKN